MYQFSRAIYRALAPHIDRTKSPLGTELAEARVLQACEAAVERLVTDRHYFARPARSLFTDIRSYFPVTSQQRVYAVVSQYMAYADEFAASRPRHGCDAAGNPLECRATTRKGTACQRVPLPNNGYCPSHQHLVETEEAELIAA